MVEVLKVKPNDALKGEHLKMGVAEDIVVNYRVSAPGSVLERMDLVGVGQLIVGVVGTSCHNCCCHHHQSNMAASSGAGARPKLDCILTIIWTWTMRHFLTCSFETILTVCGASFVVSSSPSSSLSLAGVGSLGTMRAALMGSESRTRHYSDQ